MSALHHDLKTWPAYFQRVWNGEKTFEIRLDDRGYQKHDTVTLREFDRDIVCGCPGTQHKAGECKGYSGRTITARIGFVTAATPSRGSQRGFQGQGYVVFSLCDPIKHDGRITPVTAAVPSPLEVARKVGV